MKPFDKPIYVNRPFLPPLQEFTEGLREIWDARWLSNDGPVARRLERALAERFETGNLSLFVNGTLALQLGLQALGVRGEVITTPFTFIATSNALAAGGLTPVFADIEPEYFTLDPASVESLITPATTAILAVHLFGHPCRLEALQRIARERGLRLIYDAAHSFGVRVDGKPISAFGDMSMFSFHATKPFHSAEGGALVFRDARLKATLDCLRNHGIDADGEIGMIGTNAKMNELQALMGEQVLRHFDWIIAQRGQVHAVYRSRLPAIPGIRLCPELPADVEYNYSFMPVRIVAEEFGMTRDEFHDALAAYNVFSRKYFSPPIPDLECYLGRARGAEPLANARAIADTVLALPIYAELAPEDAHRICDLIDFIRRTAGGRAPRATAAAS